MSRRGETMAEEMKKEAEETVEESTKEEAEEVKEETTEETVDPKDEKIKDLESQIKTKFSNKEDYEKYLKEQESKSLFKRDGIDLNSNDRILTLITCGYDFVNARIVVVAKEID